MSRALIVVDVQESFRQQPQWAAISNPGIAEKVNRLVDQARSGGDLVIWVLHTEPGTGTNFENPAG
jgi:nicotinamidase-related amidase